MPALCDKRRGVVVRSGVGRPAQLIRREYQKSCGCADAIAASQRAPRLEGCLGSGPERLNASTTCPDTTRFAPYGPPYTSGASVRFPDSCIPAICAIRSALVSANRCRGPGAPSSLRQPPFRLRPQAIVLMAADPGCFARVQLTACSSRQGVERYVVSAPA
jgi:hypothetical protein